MTEHIKVWQMVQCNHWIITLKWFYNINGIFQFGKLCWSWCWTCKHSHRSRAWSWAVGRGCASLSRVNPPKALQGELLATPETTKINAYIYEFSAFHNIRYNDNNWAWVSSPYLLWITGLNSTRHLHHLVHLIKSHCLNFKWKKLHLCLLRLFSFHFSKSVQFLFSCSICCSLHCTASSIVRTFFYQPHFLGRANILFSSRRPSFNYLAAFFSPIFIFPDKCGIGALPKLYMTITSIAIFASQLSSLHWPS